MQAMVAQPISFALLAYGLVRWLDVEVVVLHLTVRERALKSEC